MSRQTEFIIDGEKWKFVKVDPCPAPFSTRKHRFKICFKVEYEIEVTESQKPHEHILIERKNRTSKDEHEHLLKDFRDSGYSDCMVREVQTQNNVHITELDSSTDLENDWLLGKSAGLKEFSRFNKIMFRERSAYVCKHLPAELKAVFFKLIGESTTDWSAEREKMIRLLLRDEEKAIRNRLNGRKGRRRSKFDINEDLERNKFIVECISHLDKISRKKKNKRIYKKDLAAKICDGYKDPERSFRDKLQSFDLTYEEILSGWKKGKNRP